MARHHILFLILVVAALRLPAQTLPTGEVDVIKDFNARLIEASKFNLRPELPPLDTMTRRMTYNVTGRTIEVAYPPPKIRPLALKSEENPTIYNGYARLGLSFPKGVLAEAAYSIHRENLLLQANFDHLSIDNSDNLENQRFSNTSGKLDGTFYFEQGFAVRGGLSFDQKNVFFYGYNDYNKTRPDTAKISFASDDVKQRFSTFGVSAQIFNGVRTQADFSYSAGVDFYTLQDRYASRENGIDLKIKATKWFDERNPLDVTLRTDFTSYRDTIKQSLNNIFLQPSYTYHTDRFRVKIGVNLASSSDEFFFFPDVEAVVNILDNLLTAFAGANGSLQKNNFRNLTDYNPFMSVTTPATIRNTEYNYYFGGIKGTFFNINYEAEVGYKNTKNLALFLSNRDTVPLFDVVYDTVSIYQLKGSLTVPLLQKVNILGTVIQRFYSPRNQEKAWHLPSLSVNVGAEYAMLDDKLRLRADLFFENGVPYLDDNKEARNLNALIDLSAGAEFFFTERIGAFLRVNNLLNNKRERWQSYPIIGINGQAGVSARF